MSAAAFALADQGYEMMRQDFLFVAGLASAAYDEVQAGRQATMPADFQMIRSTTRGNGRWISAARLPARTRRVGRLPLNA